MSAQSGRRLSATNTSSDRHSRISFDASTRPNSIQSRRAIRNSAKLKTQNSSAQLVMSERVENSEKVSKDEKSLKREKSAKKSNPQQKYSNKTGYIREIPYRFQYCLCGVIRIGPGSIVICILELIVLCHTIIFAAVNLWGGADKYELYNPIFANVIKYEYLTPFLVIQLCWLPSNIMLMVGVKAHLHWLIVPHVFIKIVAIISGMILVGLCVSKIADPDTETNWELLVSISLFTVLVILEVYFCVVTWCCYKYLKMTRVKIKAQNEVLKQTMKHRPDSSDEENPDSEVSNEKVQQANQVLAFEDHKYDFWDYSKLYSPDVFVIKTQPSTPDNPDNRGSTVKTESTDVASNIDSKSLNNSDLYSDISKKDNLKLDLGFVDDLSEIESRPATREVTSKSLKTRSKSAKKNAITSSDFDDFGLPAFLESDRVLKSALRRKESQTKDDIQQKRVQFASFESF